MPVVHIGVQAFQHGLRVAPGLGGQHLNALRQQHSGFALHLHAVLQVFNDLDAVAELGFEDGEWLFAEWCAGFGGVTLPGQGVGNVELAHGQQRLRLVGPLLGDGLLRAAAFDFIQLLAQQLGRALVLAAQVLEHRLNLLGSGRAGQPLTHTRHALTRGLGGKNAMGQGIQRMGFSGFGRGLCHFGGLSSFVGGRKRKHGWQTQK